MHIPVNVKQIADVLQQLEKVHAKGFAHSDIRTLHKCRLFGPVIFD